MTDTVSPLLNRPQAAAYLNIGLRTIDEQTAKGAIASVHIGRSVRYRTAALDDFIEANESRVQPKRRRAAAPPVVKPQPLVTDGHLFRRAGYVWAEFFRSK